MSSQSAWGGKIQSKEPNKLSEETMKAILEYRKDTLSGAKTSDMLSLMTKCTQREITKSENFPQLF